MAISHCRWCEFRQITSISRSSMSSHVIHAVTVVPTSKAVVRVTPIKDICVVTSTWLIVIACVAIVNILFIDVAFYKSSLQLEPILGPQGTSEDLHSLQRGQLSHLRTSLFWVTGATWAACKETVHPRPEPGALWAPQSSKPHHRVAQTLAMNLNLSCKTEVFQDPGTQCCKKGAIKPIKPRFTGEFIVLEAFYSSLD